MVEDKVLADSIYKWSLTAGENDGCDSAINWRENQLPDTVNDSNRAMMMRIAEWRDDMTGGIVTTGTQPAYLLATKASFDNLSDGRWFNARVHATNNGPATLNVNGLGSKSIRKFGVVGDLPMAAGDLQLGGMYQFTYSSAAAAGAGGWVVSNPSSGPNNLLVPSGTAMLFVQATAPAGWTKKTDNDNKALRIVSGAGGGVGGSVAFTDAFVNYAPVVGGTALTTAQLPSHSHTQQGSFTSGTVSVDHSHYFPGGNYGSGGVSANHNHYIGAGFVGSGLGSNGGYIHASNDNNGALTGVENQAHTHATTVNGQTGGISANHTHATTISGQTATTGTGDVHTHTVTAKDFSVAYVDAIICTKD